MDVNVDVVIVAFMEPTIFSLVGSGFGGCLSGKAHPNLFEFRVGTLRQNTFPRSGHMGVVVKLISRPLVIFGFSGSVLALLFSLRLDIEVSFLLEDLALSRCLDSLALLVASFSMY